VKKSETEKPANETPPPSPQGGRDLSSLLSEWAYEDGKTVRRLKAADGHEVIQVRLPLGIEQYEMDGRPDGQRPMSCASWLHFYLAKARAAARKSEDFKLSAVDFARLHQEGLLFYFRYLLFFQIHEYRRCTRDTYRNLKLLEFLSRHARPEQSVEMEQYKPYILRMHFMARALHKLQAKQDVKLALRILRRGLKLVESLDPIEGNQIFEWEKTRARKTLEDLISQMEAQLPVPKVTLLERQMERAVREENYEQAALLRDQIASLRQKRRKPEKSQES
jgi:hypothetical protein